MIFLSHVFTEELDVVLVHLIESSTLLPSVLDIPAQYAKPSCVDRPLLPCVGERFLDLPVEPLAMLVDQYLYFGFVHADLSMAEFQFVPCGLGFVFVFSNDELASGLGAFCLCCYELKCLLVSFGELSCPLVRFLHQNVPLSSRASTCRWLYESDRFALCSSEIFHM